MNVEKTYHFVAWFHYAEPIDISVRADDYETARRLAEESIEEVERDAVGDVELDDVFLEEISLEVKE